MDRIAGRIEVEMAYRLLLGREPSVGEVDRYVAAELPLRRLLTAFLRSPEFQAKVPEAHQGTKPLDWPASRIEVDVPAPQLDRMIGHIERNWRMLGEAEPHWSVLTNSAYRPDAIRQNEDAFYGTGKASLALLRAAADRCGVDLSRLETCFELGCGVGRVTVWLAEMFRRVVAADISEPHLRLAEAAVGRYARPNVEFLRIRTIQQLDDMPGFDLFFSVIVLQHNPPPIIKRLLHAILRAGRPGSVAYFQVPTYGRGYAFDAEAYLDQAADSGKMEVHALPQSEVFGLLRQHGYEVLEVREDGWVGSATHISNSFLVRRE